MLRDYFKYLDRVGSKPIPENGVIDISVTLKEDGGLMKALDIIADGVDAIAVNTVGKEELAVYEAVKNNQEFIKLLPFGLNEYPGGIQAMRNDAHFVTHGVDLYGNNVEPQTLAIIRDIRNQEFESFISNNLSHLNLAEAETQDIHAEITAKNIYDINFPFALLNYICEKYNRNMANVNYIYLDNKDLENNNILTLFK